MENKPCIHSLMPSIEDDDEKENGHHHHQAKVQKPNKNMIMPMMPAKPMAPQKKYINFNSKRRSE